LVNKFHTLNSSSSAIVPPFGGHPLREKQVEAPIDKEAEEAFYRGVKHLDNSEPKKALTFFTQIIDKNFPNK